jgi:hypothetical protein
MSRRARTNGAVYATPGGSRHRLYHMTVQTRGTSCARRRRWSGPPCARWRRYPYPYPRSAPPSYKISNEPNNCQLNSETGSAAAVFGYPGTAQIAVSIRRHCKCQKLITPRVRGDARASESFTRHARSDSPHTGVRPRRCRLRLTWPLYPAKSAEKYTVVCNATRQ